MKKIVGVIVLLIVLLGTLAVWMFRPLEPLATIDMVRDLLDSEYIRIMTPDGYYTINGSDEFDSLYKLETWEKASLMLVNL